VRILIADDHAAVRAGVCSILQSRRDVEVCGQVANGREAVQKTGELRPDLILLDITMPVLDGFGAAKQIHEQFPEVLILFLSIHEGKQMVELAKSSGASGYVTKTGSPEVLLTAIDTVIGHGTYFPD
jgi:two-component system, NarL family, nitrate/nitrite response regulator NarL